MNDFEMLSAEFLRSGLTRFLFSTDYQVEHRNPVAGKSSWPCFQASARYCPLCCIYVLSAIQVRPDEPYHAQQDCEFDYQVEAMKQLLKTGVGIPALAQLDAHPREARIPDE
jgi:hypothetical protein